MWEMYHYHLVTADAQQDSFHSYSILEASLTLFKVDHPEMKKFIGQSDNAGNFASTYFISILPILNKNLEINIERYFFFFFNAKKKVGIRRVRYQINIPDGSTLRLVRGKPSLTLTLATTNLILKEQSTLVSMLPPLLN
jgi:hypothetical protein